MVHGKEDFAYLLHKWLHGLKKASRSCHKTLKEFIESNGLFLSCTDPPLFAHCKNEIIVQLTLSKWNPYK